MADDDDAPCRDADALFFAAIGMVAVAMILAPDFAGRLGAFGVRPVVPQAVGLALLLGATAGTVGYNATATSPSQGVLAAGCGAILLGAALGGTGAALRVQCRERRAQISRRFEALQGRIAAAEIVDDLVTKSADEAERQGQIAAAEIVDDLVTKSADEAERRAQMSRRFEALQGQIAAAEIVDDLVNKSADEAERRAQMSGR